MSGWLKWILIVVAIIILVAVSSNGREGATIPDPVTSKDMGMIGKEVKIPEGYEYVDASAFGTTERKTFYLRQKETGKIFTSDGENVLNEIKVPEGYTFLGASSYGRSSSTTTYYVKNNSNGKVYEIK
jgi:hypothetical protein